MNRLRMKMLKGTTALACALILGLTGCGSAQPEPEKKEPVNVTVWHYYNGMQKETFDSMVEEFNENVGKENGIHVEAVSKGTIKQLVSAVRDSLAGKVGAENLPSLLAAYSDMAYEVEQAGKAADLAQLFTAEELSEYMDSYIEEGQFSNDQELKLFPIAKSTELFAVNWTDWEPFAQETGATEDDFATWEGITRLSEAYYNWTDARTETPDDGKAFFGRDAFANYIIIGSLQLGHEITKVENGKVTLDFDKATMRRLWDNYYVPYVNGYFAAYGKFRSDDVKTGDLLAFVGSNSGVTYLPSTVTYEDGSSHEIESRIYPLPNFEGTSPCAVQQGAGILMLSGSEEQEEAAATFLKWFTDVHQNLEFAINSGYLPVKKAANDWAIVDKELQDHGSHYQVTDLMKTSLESGIDIVNNYRLYTAKPFAGGAEVRNILDTTMNQKAQDDRKAAVELMAGGISREEAVSHFDTDENFDEWYEDTRKQLESVGEKYGW